jgi:hypothetical protein
VTKVEAVPVAAVAAKKPRKLADAR